MNDKMIIICQNKKAHHDYFFTESVEAGIALTGTEIKSIRANKVNIQDAYCYIRNNQCYIANMNIAKYDQGNIFNHEPLRTRTLLLHKKEILKLQNATVRDGFTLIPLNVHLIRGKAKLEIGVARGKKLYDKREAIKAKDIAREKEREY